MSPLQAEATHTDFLLPDEGPADVPAATLDRRHSLYRQLRDLPADAFTRLQYLQPQVGCFNRCSFCSQHAGADVWQLTGPGLRDFVAALRRAGETHGGLGTDRIHKPRVMFPYVDNDIASYRHLDEYIRLVRDALGGTVRITTVGFSARNSELVEMHRSIATELGDGISGLRLSVTPFTYGITTAAERTGHTSRRQFREDTAAMLRIYRPLLDERLGPGKESVSVELRFRPLVARTPVVETVVDHRHAILAGPHLLLAAEPADRLPSGERVVGVRNNVPGRRDQTEAPEPIFSGPGAAYHLVTSDSMTRAGIEHFVARVRAGDLVQAMRRNVRLHRMVHRDGPYYAADPSFAPDGSMQTLLVYPASPFRNSGYNDATRFFLNALLAHKRNRGYRRREEFPDASPADVAAVLRCLRDHAGAVASFDERAALHIREEVTPLVEHYASALLAAGYPPSLFFSRDFTIDTGQAVNQGRGRALFKGLVSSEDSPANPWEDRGAFISHSKGAVWRIAPIPLSTGPVEPSGSCRGVRNELADEPSILVEELDPRHVQARDFDTGRPLRRYRITGVELERITLPEGRNRRLLPGLVDERSC